MNSSPHYEARDKDLMRGSAPDMEYNNNLHLPVDQANRGTMNNVSS